MTVRRKHLVAFAVAAAIVLCTAALSQAARPKPKVIVTVKTDRPEAVYKCGETATFSITAADEGKPVTEGRISATLSLDLGKRLDQKSLALGEKPATVAHSLKEPGFLRCYVILRKNGKTYRGHGGAAFEPERIRTMAVMPKDFDAFWAAGRAELAKIPMDVKLTPLPEKSSARQQSFMISFANVDNTRIYGFLSVPKGRKPPYPAYLAISSAGIGKPRRASGGYAAQGVITLAMGVHTHVLGLPREEYGKLAKGALRRYARIGAPDRSKYFFRRVILGLDRATNYLASRPDFDGKHLVVYGSSQGGGLTLIMAGFNQHVTAGAANVPALCDHAGYLAGRRAGWPQLAAAAPEGDRGKHLKMSAYFDAANFARRIKCPVIVSVGFIDSTCAPSSVYAAFNEIKAPKRIFHGPLTGHGYPPAFHKFFGPWRAGQLGQKKPSPPM